MRFSYIALNKSNQKTEGDISATNEAEARKRLHMMGLTVLVINEKEAEVVSVEEDKTKADQQNFSSFEFKAIDHKGKTIVGTIDAQNALTAYKRLIEEFQLEVEYLFDLALPEEEQNKAKETLVSELSKEYKQLFSLKEKEVKKNVAEEYEKENQSKLEILRNQVEVMSVQIKQLLKKIEDVPGKKSKVRQVYNLLNELARIKMSNNILHIRKLAEKVLKKAEELLKGEQGYDFIIAQKQNLKEGDSNKWEELQHHDAVEISKISGILGKATGLFKKYIKQISGNFNPSNQKEKITEQAQNISKIKKQELPSNETLDELNLLEKDTNELRQIILQNLKAVFGSGKIPAKTARQNLKMSFSVYLKKLKESKFTKEAKHHLWFEKILTFFEYQYDAARSDHENIFREINLFLIWLLCFYLIYFYLAGLILQKNLDFMQSFFYKTLTADILIFFIFFIFLFNLLILFKIKFFKQNFWGSTFVFSLGIFSFVFCIVNY